MRYNKYSGMTFGEASVQRAKDRAANAEKNAALAAKREAAAMTCQCCARKHMANTGTIAHHGYTRPGHGWQTASCMGAKHLPFEVDRTRLLEMIELMTKHRSGLKLTRQAAKKELHPIQRTYRAGFHREAEKKTFDFTRANFDSEEAQRALRHAGIYQYNFDDFKAADLAFQDQQISNITRDIDECRARYDAWKPTHFWHPDKVWVLLSKKTKRIKV